MLTKLKPGVIWNTAVFVSENQSIFEASNHSLQHLFHCKKIRTTKGKTHTIADPFLFEKDGVLYLFVEEKRANKKGAISYYSTTDLKTWTYGGVLIVENYHLSYPSVFEVDGVVYMTPESAQSNEINIYEAIDFPNQWGNKTKLLDGHFCDTNIIKRDGLYWLFTSKGYDELHIFYSNTLLSGWKPVGNNPVVKNPQFGRNGGGVFTLNNQLYRVAQDCRNSYGNGINIMKINALNTTSYKEEPFVLDFLPKKSWWNKNGSHHLSIEKFGKKTVFTIDGKSSDYYINKLIGYLINEKTNTSIEK